MLEIGTIVKVRDAYVGAGRYQNDGWSGGPYTIVGRFGDVPSHRGGKDYMLVRGVLPADEIRREYYEVIIHESRVTVMVPS